MSHRKLQEREYSEQDRMQYKLVDTESHNEKSAKIKNHTQRCVKFVELCVRARLLINKLS